MNKQNISSILIYLTLLSCSAQEGNSPQVKGSIEDRVAGGPCQGCEALFEYGDRLLNNIDTLPLYLATEPKMKISGTVYQADGKTPASNVILYVYQTNRGGIYQTQGDETGWARRHGFIRGWVKTDVSGRYTFYTFRPGAYPNRRAPEHIHLTVKEPGVIAYYMEDYLFEDDTLLTSDFQQRLTQRGGSGIVAPSKQGELLVVKRDLILGLNIPGY